MLVGQFLFSDRYMFFLPMNWFLMLMVLVLGVPGLMLFKYGKPRGYLFDLVLYYGQPRSYCASGTRYETHEQLPQGEDELMPRTTAQQERSLQDPAVCELLKIRDFLDNVMVRTDGCYVAGFRVQGCSDLFRRTTKDGMKRKASSNHCFARCRSKVCVCNFATRWSRA